MLFVRGMVFATALLAFTFYALASRSTNKTIAAFAESFRNSVLAVEGREIETISGAVKRIYSPDEQYEMAISRYVEDGDLLALEKAAKKRYGV